MKDYAYYLRHLPALSYFFTLCHSVNILTLNTVTNQIDNKKLRFC